MDSSGVYDCMKLLWLGMLLSTVLCPLAFAQNAKPQLPCEYNGELQRTEQGRIVTYPSDELKASATYKVDISGAIKQADIKGTAIVDVLVGPDGKVICARTLYGHPMFRKPVEDAISAWRFKPVIQAGKPAAYLGRLEFFLCNISCGERGPSMTIVN